MEDALEGDAPKQTPDNLKSRESARLARPVRLLAYLLLYLDDYSVNRWLFTVYCDLLYRAP
jgi:hypothetical protein